MISDQKIVCMVNKKGKERETPLLPKVTIHQSKTHACGNKGSLIWGLNAQDTEFPIEKMLQAVGETNAADINYLLLTI